MNNTCSELIAPVPSYCCSTLVYESSSTNETRKKAYYDCFYQNMLDTANGSYDASCLGELERAELLADRNNDIHYLYGYLEDLNNARDTDITNGTGDQGMTHYWDLYEMDCVYQYFQCNNVDITKPMSGMDIYDPRRNPPAIEPVWGCMDINANNYDPAATVACGTCCTYNGPNVIGCKDPLASNYDPAANIDCDDCCEYPAPPDIIGCMDPLANNYDPLATISCLDCCDYSEPPCTDFSCRSFSFIAEGGESKMDTNYAQPLTENCLFSQWVKPLVFNRRHTIFSTQQPIAPITGYRLTIEHTIYPANTPDHIHFDYYGSNGSVTIVETTDPIPANLHGQWFHIGIQKGSGWDGTTDKIYINGQSVATTVISTIPGAHFNSGLALWFGKQHAPLVGGEFFGYMDEMYRFNQTATDAQFVEMYNFGTPLDIDAYAPLVDANKVYWFRAENDALGVNGVNSIGGAGPTTATLLGGADIAEESA